MRHANVPVFVPHAGCPNRCSFCNQHIISGTIHPPTPADAAQMFAAALESLGEKAQYASLAFFGGSFTALDQSYRTSLLEAAQPFLGDGKFAGIRISTRPDKINVPILQELATYNVTAIELGVQSLDDAVLRANRRGHTARDVENASALIKEYGFSLGHQMMTGLWQDDDDGACKTALRIAALKPDTVRIYPVLVLRDTMLETLYHRGIYTPQTLENAVALCAKLLRLFWREQIPVIRLGLHDEVGLAEQHIAGPYHPAFRELCESSILIEDTLEELVRQKLPQSPITITVNPRDVSRMIGQHRINMKTLANKGYPASVRQNPDCAPFTVRVTPNPTGGIDLAPSLTRNTGL